MIWIVICILATFVAFFFCEKLRMLGVFLIIAALFVFGYDYFINNVAVHDRTVSEGCIAGYSSGRGGNVVQVYIDEEMMRFKILKSVPFFHRTEIVGKCFDVDYFEGLFADYIYDVYEIK